MQIYLSVCVDKNGGISKNNEIPWDIKEDMNFFIDQLNKPTLNKKLSSTLKQKLNTVYLMYFDLAFETYFR